MNIYPLLLPVIAGWDFPICFNCCAHFPTLSGNWEAPQAAPATLALCCFVLPCPFPSRAQRGLWGEEGAALSAVRRFQIEKGRATRLFSQQQREQKELNCPGSVLLSPILLLPYEKGIRTSQFTPSNPFVVGSWVVTLFPCHLFASWRGGQEAKEHRAQRFRLEYHLKPWSAGKGDRTTPVWEVPCNEVHLKGLIFLW